MNGPATTANGRPAHGRYAHPGYALTDAILLDPLMPVAMKLVLGATLAVPSRNPSLNRLATILPLNRAAIILAQRQLEDLELALYDRPSEAWERHPTNPRFVRSNQVIHVHPSADPTQAPGAYVKLPGHVAMRLPRGRKNAARFPLLALLYAREQLRRGAIQIEDDAAASLLGFRAPDRSPDARGVRRLREELLRAGVIRRAQRTNPTSIYVMPGATHRPADAKTLDPSRTRRLRHLPVDVGAPIRVLANEAEWAMIEGHFARLHPAYHAYACMVAWRASQARLQAPLTTKAILHGLSEAATARAAQTTGTDRSTTPYGAGGRPGYFSTFNHQEQELADDASRRREEQSSEVKTGAELPSVIRDEAHAQRAVLRAAVPALATTFGAEGAAEGRKAPKIVSEALARLADRISFASPAQAALVLQAVREQLGRIDAAAPPRQRYAQLQTAMAYLSGDDKLYDVVKAARPAPNTRVIDMLEAEFGSTR